MLEDESSQQAVSTSILIECEDFLHNPEIWCKRTLSNSLFVLIALLYQMSLPSEDLLMLLPKEVLRLIFDRICNLEDSQATIQSLLALCACSRALAVECDVARVNLMLHPNFLQKSSRFLFKLKDCIDLTVKVPPFAEHFLHSFSLVSAIAPNLVSLTLNFCSGSCRIIPDFNQVVLLWSKSLRSLQLCNCRLVNTDVNSGVHTDMESWNVQLPELTSLTITAGRLKSLCLKDCEALRMVHLERNTQLSSLEVTGMKVLNSLWCEDSSKLQSLDLSGCVQLDTLKCIGMNALTSLDLCACIALRSLHCENNMLLHSLLSLDSRVALAELHLIRNQSLQKVDTEFCGVLRNIICKDNRSLNFIQLPRNGRLKKVDCRSCNHSANFDLSENIFIKGAFGVGDDSPKPPNFRQCPMYYNIFSGCHGWMSSVSASEAAGFCTHYCHSSSLAKLKLDSPQPSDDDQEESSPRARARLRIFF